MIALKNAFFSDSKPYISSLEHASIMKFGDQWNDIINFTRKKNWAQIIQFSQVIVQTLKKIHFLVHF